MEYLTAVKFETFSTQKKTNIMVFFNSSINFQVSKRL